MGIRRIDPLLCNGCRVCVNICPMDVLRMDDEAKLPVIRYLRDCQSCLLCERDCPTEAIYVSPERERRVAFPW